jgi:hypothetical protein
MEQVQVFFPIAFYQYHPDIISRAHNITEQSPIELHKSHGWFNSYAFDQIGLYMSDYSSLKKSLPLHNLTVMSFNLYDLFVRASDIHILRAPDQSLRVHYQPMKCEPLQSYHRIEYDRCLIQREKGLASRSQLAMVIIENERSATSNVKSK